MQLRSARANQEAGVLQSGATWFRSGTACTSKYLPGSGALASVAANSSLLANNFFRSCENRNLQNGHLLSISAQREMQGKQNLHWRSACRSTFAVQSCIRNNMAAIPVIAAVKFPNFLQVIVETYTTSEFQGFSHFRSI